MSKGVTVVSAGIVSLFFLIVVACYDMPSLANLESSTRRSSVTFEAYDGTVVATYGDFFSRMVTLNELPKHVYQAVIAIEDKRFFQHGGVDIFGILRAAYYNVKEHKVVQGGSTLTQQLAKNIFLVPNRSLKRKIQEFVLSLMIERKFSKKQILAIYLNRVYFGSGAYGIEAAAFRFFGKRAKHLTLYESAKLAACLKSPTTYSPGNNPEKSDERTILVLHAMYESGFISKDDLNKCISDAEKGYFISDIMSDNRYFTDWILGQLPSLCSSNEDLIVRTTLDRRLQDNAVAVVRKALISNGFKNNVSQMALVSIDSTGAVRAMVGGHTYGYSQFNRCLAIRQPGSAFKFFVYLAALEHGMRPYDKVSDTSITVGKWRPKNYHWRSRGELTLEEAFAFSVNSCALRLAMKIGRNKIVELAERLGYTQKIPDDFTMALGSGGTSLLEMTSCYSCVMADGNKVVPYGVVSIRTKSGKVVYRGKRVIKNVIAPGICENMKALMSGVVRYGTGKRASFGIPAYGKSGTSNNSADAWFIGFCGNLATGIWVGNDDNIPMNQKVTGGTLPAETWNTYMQAAMDGADLSGEIPTILQDKKTNTRKKKKLQDFINSLG